MYPHHSPLESLAAFAIAFVCGALSALGLGKCLNRTHKGSFDGDR